MIFQKKNSVIFENPEEYILNFTALGSYTSENTEIRITQKAHYFSVGDILYFDVKNKQFSKALAVNNIQSEVCGVVSEVPNNNEFVIITEGPLETDRYKYAVSSPLYLSEIIPGALISANPTFVMKQVAVQIENGIQVNIKAGYCLSGKPLEVILEPYTKEELDDIILNVKG